MTERSQPPTRARLTRDERRRQLVGIGLRFLTERPIQEVSLDRVADEAGISRSLLFHYFPTKTAFYEAVVRAAGRRVVRTVRPDEGVTGSAAVRQLLARFVAQIDRRRDVYLALVQGNLADLGGAEVAGSLRERLTDIVVEALGTRGDQSGARPAVHAWFAYVEDIAIRWSATVPSRRAVSQPEIVEHAETALDALLALPTVASLRGVGESPQGVGSVGQDEQERQNTSRHEGDD